jgi:hypothetical protein
MEGRSWTWKASFVAARILAVYLLVRALILIGSELSFLFQGSGGLVRWSVIFAIVLTAAAGIMVWLGADQLSDRIAGAADELDLPDEDEGSQPAARPTVSIDATSALSIGLTILGIIVLLDAVTALFITISQLVEIASPSFGGFSGVSRSPLYFQLASEILRGAVGAWLIFGSQDIAGVLRRLRAQAPQTEAEE